MATAEHHHDEPGRLATEASPGTPGDSYTDGNDRDIDAKQKSPNSALFNDPEIDATKVEVLSGMGGPDDVDDTEAEPDDYNRIGQ